MESGKRRGSNSGGGVGGGDAWRRRGMGGGERIRGGDVGESYRKC